MSAIGRVWFGAVVAVVLVVAAVQARDAWTWATGPWLGFTLGDGGRIVVRDLDDAPSGLRGLLRQAGEGGVWASEIYVTERPIPYRSSLSISFLSGTPQAPAQILRDVLAPLPEGSLVLLSVTVSDWSSNLPAIPLSVGRVPARLVFELCGLYAGLGLLIAASGLFVFYLRPDSRPGLIFSLAMVLFGVELMTSQVAGGFPSRLGWLAAASSFAFPAAIAHLALTLTPRVRPDARRSSLPWLIAIAAVLLAARDGSIIYDWNLYLVALRVAAWVFFVGYLVWARRKAPTRQEKRRLELYLGGLALAFLPPLVVYARHHPGWSLPSPWWMLSLLLFPLILGYGIVKHRLFDIDVFLRRGLAYTLVAAVATGLYGLLVAGGSIVFGMAGASRSPIATAGFVVVAIMVGSALRRRLQRVVDRGINPDRFHYLEALRQASRELGAMREPEAVARGLVRIATADAGLSGAAVYLTSTSGFTLAAASEGIDRAGVATLTDSDPVIGLARVIGGPIHRDDFDSNTRLASLRGAWQARMDPLGAVLLLPIGAEDQQLAGALAVGPRRDQAPLNDEDMALLEMLASTAASALARARAVAPPPPRATLAADARIGHYRLEREVGRGGMGEVWKARDERLDRVVALKFLRSEHKDDDVVLERTRREARVLAALNHPAIVRIHALEEIEGLTFLAMEYVEGPTLAAELAGRGRFTPQDAAEVAIGIVAALECAFARGVIHRDVKPENVLLAADGVKLTDFGLARSFVSADSVTASGAVVGTLPYLAPELFEHQAASFRSDMYALGVTLHALVTGHGVWRDRGSRPWFADSGRIDAATLRLRGVPPVLVPVLERLLERDPEDRYPDYRSLRGDLARAREGLHVS